MSGNDPYSNRRIATGAAYLIGGKAVSAIASLVTFMLLVRGLPIEQFAAYTMLFALTELAEAATGVGISHILGRYVPELLVQRRMRTLCLLIGYGLALRAAVVATVLGLAWLTAPLYAPLIGLEDWGWALRMYAFVVFARIISMALFGILEAMLRQKIAQLGASSVTLARCVMLAVAGSSGSLDLETVIVIELVTDIVGAGIGLVGVLIAIRPTADTEAHPLDWLRLNRSRMLEFGLKGYLQHMLIMPYNGSTNRLLVGSHLTSPEVALFGFAQGFADMMGRYLPVNLLSGIIRPVLTARYVRDGRFEDTVGAANLTVKISGAIALLVAVAIYAGSEPLLNLATKGKYGDGLTPLLLLMCAVVIMYTVRASLDQVCHAVERNGPLIWSNIVIASSIVPGILLLPIVGVYAMPLSTLGGLLLGCAVLLWRLRVGGFRYRHDFGGLARLVAAMLLGMLGADVLRGFDLAWPVVLAAGVSAYLVALVALGPASRRERDIVAAVLGKR